MRHVRTALMSAAVLMFSFVAGAVTAAVTPDRGWREPAPGSAGQTRDEQAPNLDAHGKVSPGGAAPDWPTPHRTLEDRAPTNRVVPAASDQTSEASADPAPATSRNSAGPTVTGLSGVGTAIVVAAGAIIAIPALRRRR